MRLLLTISLLIFLSCSQKKVEQHGTMLNLSGLKLKTIPDSVFSKTELTYLDLGSSNVVFYPPLSSLVDTNTNKITEIPTKIDNLINLKTLILNSNNLTSLPSSISNLANLQVLDLSVNRELVILKELEKLKALKHLEVLKIVEVQMNKNDIELIKKTLPNTKIIFNIPEYLKSLK